MAAAGRCVADGVVALLLWQIHLMQFVNVSLTVELYYNFEVSMAICTDVLFGSESLKYEGLYTLVELMFSCSL